MKKKGIMFNQDSDNFFHTRKNMTDIIDEKYLKNFILQYKDTNVTDFLICANVTLSAFPSKIKTFYGDKYAKGSAEYDTVFRAFHEIWQEKGYDVFKIWIDTLREVKITPWLSFRMNDAHCHFDNNTTLLSDWFLKHIDEYARIRHTPYYTYGGYFNRCRDYEIEAVRKEMLDYIEESLNRYDVDGIELDFMREMWCFQVGHEQNNCDVMTDFIKAVKSITLNAEKRYGHKIKIGVKTDANPIYCLEFGFDVANWAKHGLIDLVVPSSRWFTTDNDMPLTLWKRMLEPYNVKVAGCIEMQIHPSFDPQYRIFPNTVESVMGSACNILSQEADKIYLYNYFDFPQEMMLGERRKITDENDWRKAEGYYKMLTTIGDFDKIINCSRKNIVSYNDSHPLSRSDNSILPIKVDSKNYPYYIRIVTGTIKSDSKAYLRIGVDKKINPDCIKAYVNSNECEFLATEECGVPQITDSIIYVFEIPSSAYGKLVQMAEIFSCERFNIDYADITIKVK